MPKHPHFSEKTLAWLKSMGARDPGTTYSPSRAYAKPPIDEASADQDE